MWKVLSGVGEDCVGRGCGGILVQLLELSYMAPQLHDVASDFGSISSRLMYFDGLAFLHR